MAPNFILQPEHSVNVREFDEQHRQMVSLINELYASMPMEASQGIQERIIEELLEYAEAHFQNEERILREHGFPGAQEHERAHAELRKKMLELQEQHRQGRLSIPLVVSSYLQTWLTEHILATDKQYVSFLNERGVN